MKEIRELIVRVLKEHGIRPAPERPTSWRTFLRSHADVIAATDFFTTEVWTTRGLITHYTLFVIDIATRAVHIAGTTTNPNEAFMAQVAHNLTDCVDGFLRTKRFLILDNDTKFTARLRQILKDVGVNVVFTSLQAPDMNSFSERWVRSIKSECLDEMILFGSEPLERAISTFVSHYHEQRPHQGLDNELINGKAPSGVGDVGVREQLGGLLRYYHRSAA